MPPSTPRYCTPQRWPISAFVSGTVDSQSMPIAALNRYTDHDDERRQQEQSDHHRPDDVDRRQQPLARQLLAEQAGGERADHVEQSDQRHRGGADVARHALVEQVGRQMQCDEYDLQPADEVAPEQQVEAAVGDRAAQCIGQTRRSGARGGRLLAAHAEREQQDRRDDGRVDQQSRLPAERADQLAGQRQEQELAERAGGDADAEREAALLCRHDAPERGQDDAERGAADRDAHHDARRQRQRRAALGPGHAEETKHEQHRTQQQRAHRAVLVGHRPEERTAQPPHQVLQRDREREGLARPAARLRHLGQEQPERRARAGRDHQDRAAEQQHRQIRRRTLPAWRGAHQVTARSARSAAAIVVSTSSSLCAPEKKNASTGDGGR